MKPADRPVLLFISIVSFLCLVECDAQQPPSPLLNSHETFQELKRDTQFGLEWINISPTVNSARVEAVQLDPSRPGTMYVAFGSGGLWKSVDNGISWEPKFEGQASYGIGDFALAPSDPNVIYLGTGESLKKARNFTIPGTGVYRSDDGGDHWQHLGLPDVWHIGEIAVHPLNPDIVLVAGMGHFWSENPNRGLYRTEDGGKTWHHVLAVDEHTAANDVVWALDDPNVVYASTWQNYPDVSGETSSVYRSHDAGKSWEPCAKGLPAGEQIGRIGLAVSQTNARKVYALVDHRGRIEEGAAQVYRSIDGGESWQRTHQDELLIFSRIGWYFADIYVNPSDDDEIFALGVRLAHSIDGGKTFDLVSGKVAHLVPSAASGLHLDHCELWINPGNPQHLVLGNDGGLYQSFDKGESWLHYNNLPTGEFYDIALDTSSPYRIFAGAQDDATVFGTAQELGPSRTRHWEYLWIDPWNGGDGCVTQVDPKDNNTVYFSAQEGAFRRKNMMTNRSTPIPARLPKDHAGELEFNFVAPLIISPHDSNTLYLGGNYLFKSSNRGDDWRLISEDLTNSSDAQKASTAAGAIAESPLLPGLLYVGTDRGALWVSEDDGKHWEERSQGLPVGYVRSIAPSRFDVNRVYVAATGLNYDDLNTYLFCSEDRGVTWSTLAGNLSDEPANVIVEDPFYPELLYAGTFRGVYLSTNRGNSWSLIGRNLPTCSIGDMEVQEREKDLVVGTHGRGVFKLNLQPIHEFYTKGLASKPTNYLFPIPTAVRPYQSDIRPSENFRAFEKTTISFCVVKPGSVTLAVFNEDGERLTAIELTANAGLNQFRWDLVLETSDSPQPYFFNYKKHLKPGQYHIQLLSDDFPTQQRPLNVVDDRR